MFVARNIATIALVALLPFALSAAVETRLTFIDPDPATGTSKAVITDNLALVHTSQTLPFDAGGEITARDAGSQTERVLAILEGTLVNFNCDRSTITKLNIYISDTNDMPLASLGSDI